MSSLFVAPKQSPTSGGDNYASGKFYLFESGTLTPAVTYQDADLTTPHAHPIVADGGGVFPAVWLSSGVEYRVQLKTFTDVTVYDIDPYPAGPSDIAYLAAENVFTADQQINANLDIFGDASVGDDLSVTGDLSAATLVVSGATSLAAVTASGTATLSGALDHDGSTIGFYGKAPAVQASLTQQATTKTTTQLRAELSALQNALHNLGLVVIT